MNVVLMAASCIQLGKVTPAISYPCRRGPGPATLTKKQLSSSVTGERTNQRQRGLKEHKCESDYCTDDEQNKFSSMFLNTNKVS